MKTEPLSPQTLDLVKNFIGPKRLYGLRNGKNRVQFFVADDNVIHNVTMIVARVTGHRRSNAGWIIAPDYGYCPVQGIISDFAAALSKSDHPFGRL